MYRVKRRYQIEQAIKAGIDYKVGEYLIPEDVDYWVYREQRADKEKRRKDEE